MSPPKKQRFVYIILSITNFNTLFPSVKSRYGCPLKAIFGRDIVGDRIGSDWTGQPKQSVRQERTACMMYVTRDDSGGLSVSPHPRSYSWLQCKTGQYGTRSNIRATLANPKQEYVYRTKLSTHPSGASSPHYGSNPIYTKIYLFLSLSKNTIFSRHNIHRI